MKKIAYIFVLLFFFSAFGKNIKTVKIKNIDLNIERKVSFADVFTDNDFPLPKERTQHIEAHIPLIKFPYKNKLFEDVKKQVYQYLIPVVGDRYLLEFRSEYEIGINDGRIFSIKLYSYEYYLGAAHGNSDMVAINVDLKCKRFIRFFDIFAEKKHIYDEKTKTYREIFPLEEIKKILKEKIKNHQKCPIFEEEFDKCSYIPQIFLKKDGIEFVFPKYEVTPGACDSFSVELPYKELKIYMREDVNFLKF